MGRRTKLTPEVEDKIVTAIRGGCPYRVAAQLAGISESTFYNWIKLGEEGQPPYAEFLAAVQKANAEIQAKLTFRFSMAADEDWRAARDFLARRWPGDWSEGREAAGGREGPPTEDRPLRLSLPEFADPKVREALQRAVEAVGEAREAADGDWPGPLQRCHLRPLIS